MTPADLLHQFYARRKQTKPQYSLRAFARDCEISASHLSEVMANKSGLSLASAMVIATKLKLSAFEESNFLTVVESYFSRNSVVRKIASVKSKVLTSDCKTESLDTFALISDWYHFGLLEYLKIEKSTWNPTEAAKVLGITPAQVDQASKRLKLHGFIEEINGVLKVRSGSNSTQNDVPSEAIRRFHEQVLQKALIAIQSLSTEERDFQTLLFASKKNQLPFIKEKIRDLITSVDNSFCFESDGDCVFCNGNPGISSNT